MTVGVSSYLFVQEYRKGDFGSQLLAVLQFLPSRLGGAVVVGRHAEKIVYVGRVI